MAVQRIKLPRERLADFCRRNRIRRLALFGSALRDDFRDDSDVDLLVEFDEGADVSLLDMVRLEDELSAIVGRSVDLRTPAELSRYFREKVVQGAVVLYEAE